MGKRARIYYIISLLCGIWFLLTGWIWGYYANVIIAYPFALLGLFFWWRGKQNHAASKLNLISFRLLIFGLIVSVGTALVFIL